MRHAVRALTKHFVQRTLPAEDNSFRRCSDSGRPGKLSWRRRPADCVSGGYHFPTPGSSLFPTGQTHGNSCCRSLGGCDQLGLKLPKTRLRQQLDVKVAAAFLPQRHPRHVTEESTLCSSCRFLSCCECQHGQGEASGLPGLSGVVALTFGGSSFGVS